MVTYGLFNYAIAWANIGFHSEEASLGVTARDHLWYIENSKQKRPKLQQMTVWIYAIDSRRLLHAIFIDKVAGESFSLMRD
jgi:hypothetical protein